MQLYEPRTFEQFIARKPGDDTHQRSILRKINQNNNQQNVIDKCYAIDTGEIFRVLQR